jgi:methylated-DNA-[protein]-cysteine S-methyltransferase
MVLTYDDNYILGLFWPETVKHSQLIKDHQHKDKHPLVAQLKAQLSDYYLGKRYDFNLPLNPQGTDFQKKAWSALSNIPYGQTRSYQEQAAAINCPKGFRAAGTANSKNPISILIPCHRVIGKNGQLSGYAGGPDTKKKLLELEKLFLDSKKID